VAEVAQQPATPLCSVGVRQPSCGNEPPRRIRCGICHSVRWHNVRRVRQVSRAKRRRSRRTPKGANVSYMECGGRGCKATGDTALQCRRAPTILRQRTLRENPVWNLPRWAMAQCLACHPSGAGKAASQPPHSKRCERELYGVRWHPWQIMPRSLRITLDLRNRRMKSVFSPRSARSCTNKKRLRCGSFCFPHSC
jgi:hypothetical protein